MKTKHSGSAFDIDYHPILCMQTWVELVQFEGHGCMALYTNRALKVDTV